MITVAEIKKKSERKYEDVLKISLNGESCFPMEIRSNKVLSKNFIKMSKEIAEVLGWSKDRKGFGYSVISERIKTRQHGIQDIPKSIVYETLDDYLKFIKKEKEFRLLIENYSFIKTELPQLKSWLNENPKAIINNANVWPDLIKVCQWFIHCFEPDKYYIRELPISVHTKFIEENRTVLRFLLDELVPDIVLHSENLFEKRYRLKYDQSLVRFRSLDHDYWEITNYDDLTVPIEQFAKNPINCKRVFIIENKMNFLSFPEVPYSFAIWGKGFAIETLKNIQWLKNKQIYYWSDLDVQGFQMLSQLRSYFPQTKSFLMDMKVLEKYREFIVSGSISNVDVLSDLSVEEQVVYEYLTNNNYRLEQERVDQSIIIEKLNQLFNS